MTPDWQGDERRSIPVHILNHIDARQEELATRMEGRVSEVHGEVIEITKELRALRDSIVSYMEKSPTSIIDMCEIMVDEAIPTSVDNPDATPKEKRKEHRTAHTKWMKKVNDEMARWQNIRNKVSDWAIIGVLTAIVYAAWWALTHFFTVNPK